MDAKLKQNRQMRSIGIALVASILAAVATMFIPASVLESLTGASGLSELIPSTAAPLGDTARALIAFGTGALTLALLSVILLRQHADSPVCEPKDAPAAPMASADNRDLVASLKERIANFRLPKMPWDKSDNDITDLSDLPKLRGGDIHPDAPARRPLSATHDLPVLDLTEIASQPAAKTEQIEIAVEQAVSEPAIQPARETAQPTLAEMVEQLEASAAQRQRQLAELEVVAANLALSKATEIPSAAHAETVEVSVPTASHEPRVETIRPEWPPLEAVPESSAKQDDMDDALAAALATLHRMNGTAG